MLFKEHTEIKPNTDPPDGTEIHSILLYFSLEESIEFKNFCKEGMRANSGRVSLEHSNVSDFLLNLLRTTYGQQNSTEEVPDRKAGASS